MTDLEVTKDDLAVLSDLQSEIVAHLPEEPDALSLRRIQALALVRHYIQEGR